MKILRIIFLVIITIMVILGLIKTPKIETNLMNAFFHNSENLELLKLSQKNSSEINIIFESDNFEDIEETKDHFIDLLDKNIKIKNYENEQILDYYKKYKTNILSQDDYNLLKSKDYNEITQKAIENLYNPFGVTLLAPKEDAFNLFTDYIKDFQQNEQEESDNGKCYEIIHLQLLNAQSPTKINSTIKKITAFKPGKTVKMYFTGIPIHSYYASTRSILEINIISTLSLIFVGGFIYWYFKSFRILLVILLTLLGGFITGYFTTGMIFKKIHILTFIFSTTLIGICVDYSLHYFCDRNNFIKNLTLGLISTVGAIFTLYFSGIELLKQVSIFTSCGLIFVYFVVILFYPLLNLNFKKNIFKFSINKKFLYLYLLIIIVILPFIKFNDNIKTMYKPSQKMINAEKIYSQLSGNKSNASFILIEGKSLEDILQKEEIMTNKLSKNSIRYYSLSKFLPSRKKQLENFKLQQKLYDNEFGKIKQIITDAEKPNFNSLSFIDETIFKDVSFLNDFFISKNKTYIVLFADKKTEGINSINISQEFSKKIQQIRHSCLKILLPIFGFLFLLMSMIFSYKNAVKILAPTAIACLFSAAVIHELNVFHILSLFLIIGFGLDYSIFRFSGSKYSKDAVFISCMTTVFSFFMLSLTGFKLISSIGSMVCIGLLSSYILSILLISKE